MGGYVTSYNKNKFEFLTIRGAGHMVSCSRLSGLSGEVHVLLCLSGVQLSWLSLTRRAIADGAW